MHRLGWSRANEEELQHTLQYHVDQAMRDAAYYVLTEMGVEVVRDGTTMRPVRKSNLKRFDELNPIHDVIEEMQVVKHAAGLARLTHTDCRITWCVGSCTLTPPRVVLTRVNKPSRLANQE
jgi:hypothetical protein